MEPEINAKQVLLSNGCSVESMINGFIKNLDLLRNSPINIVMGTFVPDFVEDSPIVFEDKYYPLGQSDIFKIDGNIVKLINASYTERKMKVQFDLQFDTVNTTESTIDVYFAFIPRYYLNDDFENPTRWGTHAHYMNVSIDPGTRRWVFPYMDTFNFGPNTTGFDFIVFPVQETPEGLTYTIPHRCNFSFETYSMQYQ